MSQRRVIVGTDHEGRPVSRWTDPEPVTAYGFMEHATESTVTRRKATPAELAAVTARDTAPGYLRAKPIVETLPTGSWEGMRMTDERDERMRDSRMRGVVASHGRDDGASPLQRKAPSQVSTRAAKPTTPVHPIVAEVARRHAVTVAGLLSRSRRLHLVDARAEAARRMNEAGMRVTDIATALDRDHSSVHVLIRRKVTG